MVNDWDRVVRKQQKIDEHKRKKRRERNIEAMKEYRETRGWTFSNIKVNESGHICHALVWIPHHPRQVKYTIEAYLDFTGRCQSPSRVKYGVESHKENMINIKGLTKFREALHYIERHEDNGKHEIKRFEFDSRESVESGVERMKSLFD